MSIVTLQEASDAALYGGKAVALGAALRAGLPVPRGLGVSVTALTHIAEARADVLATLHACAAKLCAPLAARSSAVGEDGVSTSFAGQHASVLNLGNDASLVRGLLEVHASARHAGALAYRDKHGVDSAVQMAAVVQELIDPVCAGVLFTRNPLTGADERVVEAAWGLGEGVVAGLLTPDHFRVARDGTVLEARVGDKDIAVRRAADGGTHEVPVSPELVDVPCLDSAALAELHALALQCEATFGRAIDLEWAFTGDALYLLQARPISTVVK
jgi:pyruvate,water dikinase